jgi:predicted ATPase
MIALDGYRVDKCLASRSTSVVYVASRDEDDLRVAIKLYRSYRAASRAQRELAMLQRAAGPGVPRVIELTHLGTRPALVMELVEGSTLASVLEGGAISVSHFLEIAVQLVQVVRRVHDARIIHKDIKPENIQIDGPDRVWLIDFGCAVPFGSRQEGSRQEGSRQEGSRQEGSRQEGSRQEDGGRAAATFEGTLLYISPEATGRMDRGIDARSDLYSLGATFYHILTGRCPFASSDSLELIHCHMARMPAEPATLRPELPVALSRMVIKLLQKQPEERYQSAHSLGEDLRRFRDQLAGGHGIPDDFSLGMSIVPERPIFPKRMYGREREYGRLADALSRITHGGSEFWTVCGPPGSGKSTLVSELRMQVCSSGGYFAVGRFDLARREFPYSGWSIALDALLQNRLAEGAGRLEAFSTRLMAGLGNLAGAMHELVPDLRHVIGELPSVPKLEPLQAQQRLALAVQRFVCACATTENPLVLFFDDMQWADAASLYLIEDLLVEAQPGALLLVGAHRDADPHLDEFQTWLARLEARGSSPHRLTLGPLDEDACVQMLAQALKRTAHDVQPLARRVVLKTGNLPLLVQQFIEHAHELGLIRFSQSRGWVWDESAIAAAEIPDDAVAFVAARIERLEPTSRAILELASSAADTFDTQLLSELGGGSQTEIESGLYVLCNEGLITPCPEGFRFVHSRLRESVLALIPEEKRARIHYTAAHLLLSSLSADARAERVFELVDHFNRASALLEDPDRMLAIELNLAAAVRSLAAGAPSTAHGYLHMGRSLFQAAYWSAAAHLGTTLWLRSASCAHQIGALDECLALLDALESRPLTLVDQASATAQRIAVHAVRHEVERAARLGLSALHKIGVRWPLHPRLWRVRWEETRLAFALRGRGHEAFHPTPGYEPRSLAFLILASALGGPASRVDVRLMSLLAAATSRVQLRQGYLRGPHLAFAGLASSLCRYSADGARARRYAELAEALSRKIPDPIYRCRTEMVLRGSVYPWLMPRVQCLEHLLQVRDAALELGDREFALYASADRTYGRLFSGVSLSSVLDELAVHVRSPLETSIPSLAIAAIRALETHCETTEIDRNFLALETHFNDTPQLGTHSRLVWVLVMCVLGRHADAFAQSERIGDPPTLGTVCADLAFLHALSAASLATAPGPRRAKYRKILRRATRKLTAWSRHGPDFVHMAELLRGEEAALRNRPHRARAHYDAAARRAKQVGYVHHAALAREREGELLCRLRREIDAARAFERASRLYEEWGARGKVLRLNERIRSAGLSMKPT